MVSVLAVGLSNAVPVAPPAAAASPRPANFPTAGDFVEWAYEQVLGREPDPAGASFWVPFADGGGDPVTVLDLFAGSGEVDAWTGMLIRLYRSAFARAADPGGLTSWLSLRRSGVSPAGIPAAFAGSVEFGALYGGTSDAEFVRRVYVNAFGRQPDSGGSAFWVGRLQAGVPRSHVLFVLSESAEHRHIRFAEVAVTGAYIALLERMPDPGGESFWHARLRAGGAPREVIGSIWQSPELANRLATVPSITVTQVVGGLQIPWGLDFAPDGTMLFTERRGVLSVRLTNGTVRALAADMSDLFVGSEAGLLDLFVDPGFASNRRFYTCQARRSGSSPLDVAVIAWTVDAAYTTATRVASPLLGGLPISSGRHSGCRIVADPTTANVLYVATGDAAIGSTPQNLSSLGGKVLRISATTGEGVAGNPLFGSANANQRRIWNFGHRNLQGMAVRPGSGHVYTAEHGPDRDDEINFSFFGGNYGWNPVPGYNEAVPMTDLAEFPSAIPAVWSSGFPTTATSGSVFLEGCHWGAFHDHLAVANLKGSELHVHTIAGNGVHLGVANVAALDGSFGRLRTAVMGPDGSLYVTTSNGSGDRILRVTPSGGRCPA